MIVGRTYWKPNGMDHNGWKKNNKGILWISVLLMWNQFLQGTKKNNFKMATFKFHFSS